MQGAAVRAINAHLEVQRAASRVRDELELDEITQVGIAPAADEDDEDSTHHRVQVRPRRSTVVG